MIVHEFKLYKKSHEKHSIIITFSNLYEIIN